jgi:hypothetical protein
VSRALASVPVACGGARDAQCGVRLVLSAVETFKRGKLVALTAAVPGGRKAGARAARRAVLLGSAALRLRAGQSRTVQLQLNAVGRRLLAARHRLPARLTVVLGGRPIATAALQFRSSGWLGLWLARGGHRGHGAGGA